MRLWPGDNLLKGGVSFGGYVPNMVPVDNITRMMMMIRTGTCNKFLISLIQAVDMKK